MIAFVIPFRSKATSDNWPLHSSLLLRTLNSLLNQTDKNFLVILVYTDLPDFRLDHENLVWLQFPYDFLKVKDIDDYESYAKPYFSTEIFAEYGMDQARKSTYGCKLAKEMGSEYIMSVDADDLVSNKMAKFVNLNSSSSNPGWYVNKGYVFVEGTKYIYRYPKNLNSFCGSTYIVRADLVSIPDFKSRNLLDYNFFSGHVWLKERLKQYHNAVLLPFPLYAIIYILNSVSWGGTFFIYSKKGILKWVKIILYGQLLSKKIKNEFHLNKI